MTSAPRVLLHNDTTDDMERALARAHADIEIHVCGSYAALPEALARFRPDIVYTVRFDGMRGFPRDALFGPDGPKWIANGGVGIDHFGSWDPRRVTVTNAAGVAADMMAEYVMGGFLHFSLDVDGLQQDKAARLWRARRVVPLKGKTLLIIGLGNTGQALARRAKAFGMRVTGTRATPRPMEYVDVVTRARDLPALLPAAEYIAVATPLIDQTRGLLGRDFFARMTPGVVLADVSRGGVIDQEALLDALRRGVVAGAVLDVFEQEPLPQDNPLWLEPNVLLSPHCSSVYDGWETDSFDMFLLNLAAWRRGKPMSNVVDPARGY